MQDKYHWYRRLQTRVNVVKCILPHRSICTDEPLDLFCVVTIICGIQNYFSAEFSRKLQAPITLSEPFFLKVKDKIGSRLQPLLSKDNPELRVAYS